MKLGDIAEIIQGYAFRSAITPVESGDLFVFQAKDLVRGVPFSDVGTLTQIPFVITGHIGYIKTNDVLLVARGMKAGTFRSTTFKAVEQNVLASSSVHILRVTASNVLPEYLSHYLNSKRGQTDLSDIVTGSYIGALPRRALEQIKIPIPNSHKQKAIIDLYNNIQAQQKILDRKNELKQQIIEATFTNITKHHD